MINKIKQKIRNWILSGNYIQVAKKLSHQYIKPSDKVLDIGPGQGEILHLLRTLYGNHVELYALDRHDEVLNNLPENTHLTKMNLWDLLNYEQGLQRIPFPDKTFDAIIFTEIIEHVIFPQILLAEVSRILKPGGFLILTTPNIHCLGNRLAVLMGVDKIFPRVGGEGFIAKLDFHPYGHVAHYSMSSLTQMLSPWFDIVNRTGAGFKVPILRYLQPICANIFPTLANSLVMVCSRKELKTTDLAVVTCPLMNSAQLILPDGRCLHSQAHSKTCNSCQYFHKDFLHKRDRKNAKRYVPEGK